MSKTFTTLKIDPETLKKFRQAKRLREFKMNESLTMSEFMELILEQEFRRYDGQTIERVK